MSDIIQKLRAYRPRYGWPEEYSTIVEPTMNHVAADEIERLRAENERLREALECLVDEQNGPPLLGHERSWCAAMEKARAALGEEGK